VDLVTLDFETFYDKDFSLRKMTTEAYVRDPRFEVIGVGVKRNDGKTEWASGTHNQIKKYLTETVNWAETMLLCHNTMFDGAILSWCFDIRPRVYTDTVCIARAVHGTEASASLAALSERYDIGVKGTEVLDAKGKRRRDFTPEELSAYGDYCINDVELTRQLFNIMASGLVSGTRFPPEELKLIDLTLRMFTEPTLQLDKPLLHSHLADVKGRKDKLLQDAKVSKADLMSNPKFAELLKTLNVDPPMKISPANGKETFAFAKNDEGFKELLEHEDTAVQALATARIGTKSTLEETRTQRFIGIAERGALPVPVRYYAAHTGRWGGDDKINLQNLPSRGANGKKLKRSIIAPDGHTMIDCDSSQIEARVLAWLAGQDDLTAAFKNGDDVYKHMASSIYSVPSEDVTDSQRFVGKTTILGAGYGMGAVKFQTQLAGMGVEVELREARRIIQIYRKTNGAITQLWTDANNMIAYMARGDDLQFGKDGVLAVDASRNAIILPSGLPMFYHALGKYATEDGQEYMYKTRKGMVRIYGGKVVENVCQAIARCIIGHQMILIAKRYKVALTVHDSIVIAVRDEEVDEARTYVEHCMSQKPDWADGLPITCESGTGKSYGDCE
jgi:DNA polymerase I-like protein with 3'-5' exonuclease and polymerase domains